MSSRKVIFDPFKRVKQRAPPPKEIERFLRILAHAR